MYDFPELLKNIRKEIQLTQADLAKKLGVSAVLIAMVESGQKEPSKKFVERLAAKMEVSPRAIIPFIYNTNKYIDDSAFEERLSRFGMNLQKQLITKKAKNILK